MSSYRVYPLSKVDNFDVVDQKRHFTCLLCGEKVLPIRPISKNLRESIKCSNCKSINRQRQIVRILLEHFANIAPVGRELRTLQDVDSVYSGISIYNTECNGAIHQCLSKNRFIEYTSSEYLGPTLNPGAVINGVLHQDLQNLSFADHSFDVVLSSEVFEHIPDPYKAFREIYRILKSKGSHIFTVPFNHLGYRDDVRSRLIDNKIVFLKRPIYHDDPVRPGQGVLVYTIFSMEMMIKLEEIGFKTNFYRLNAPEFGIHGSNALLFDAIKI